MKAVLIVTMNGIRIMMMTMTAMMAGWTIMVTANVMSSRDFEIVKDQLRKEWFEKNRLISAKVIIGQNLFHYPAGKRINATVHL